MSTKHTSGLLIAEDNNWDMSTLYSESGCVVAQCPISGDVTEDTQHEYEEAKEANARRIAACWNACAGIRTEALENRAHLLKAEDQQITELEAQRDELLEALLKCARMAEALKRECGMDPESPQALRNGEYMNISYTARAALAKAKGEAA